MTNSSVQPKAKTRVFTSFDFDHDEDLRMLFVGQARNPRTPFEIVDWSVKEKLSGNWKGKVRERIRRVDKVVVMCGEHTDRATGVSEEVRIAREEKKPCYFVRGRSDRTCRLPKSVLPSDRMVPWTWEILAATLKEQPRFVNQAFKQGRLFYQSPIVTRRVRTRQFKVKGFGRRKGF